MAGRRPVRRHAQRIEHHERPRCARRRGHHCRACSARRPRARRARAKLGSCQPAGGFGRPVRCRLFRLGRVRVHRRRDRVHRGGRGRVLCPGPCGNLVLGSRGRRRHKARGPRRSRHAQARSRAPSARSRARARHHPPAVRARLGRRVGQGELSRQGRARARASRRATTVHEGPCRRRPPPAT